MISYRAIPGLILGAVLACSASADRVILDDLIVKGVSDGTAPAYDCSPGATLPFFPSFDNSSVIETIPPGDPVIVVDPIFSTCLFASGVVECEYTCSEPVGAACVGVDCASDESFDAETLKLKENNLRIRLHDTSITGGPGQSWNLEANASSDAGFDYFDFQASSVEQDSARLSNRKDGPVQRLQYDCSEARYAPPSSVPFFEPWSDYFPVVGTVPVGEPLSIPAFDFPLNCLPGSPALCLARCQPVPWWDVRSVLTFGTASDEPFGGGVAIGYESAVEDGVVTVGRAGAERRIVHVAAGMVATDALTLGEMQFSLDDLPDEATLLLQQISDFRIRLDEIAVLVGIAEIDIVPGADMTNDSETVNDRRLQVFRDTVQRAIGFADSNPRAACAELSVALGFLSERIGWFATTATTLRLTADTAALFDDYGCT